MSQDIPEEIKRQQEFVLKLLDAEEARKGLLNEQNNTFESIMDENPIQEGTYE